MFTIGITPHKLRFKKPAGTSRGIYHEHRVWYVVLQDAEDPAHTGIGEPAPLSGLSSDHGHRYEERLSHFCRPAEQQQ